MKQIYFSAGLALTAFFCADLASAHGTVVSPKSRVYRVYQSNPDNSNFALAQSAVAIDGTLSYYTWNEVSRNLSAAVQAGLPPGFDYSPWVPDGQLASAGRVDPQSTEYPRTYAGLDQVSDQWPTTAGTTIEVDFLATAVHSPSVWDIWMTTPDWDPNTALNWGQLEFLGRPQPTLDAGHFRFPQLIPANRTGHHVLWVAWQRDDPVGEVFFSACDIMIAPDPGPGSNYCVSNGNSGSATGAQISASGTASVAANDLTLLAGDLPANVPGIFFHGSGQAATPFGEGVLCVATNIVRIPPPSFSGASGELMTQLDNQSAGGIGIASGVTRNFQAWFRDTSGGPSGFNLSDARSVTFLP
jgi:predicted carbohydrate-binding protein with CBM5 and CBM33 domain